MDTDCLQEEICVIPERTSIVSSNPVPSRKDDKEDAGGMQGSTHYWNSMKEIMGGSGAARPTSRIEAAKLSLKKAVNGDGGERSTEGGGEEDFKAPSEVAMLRDAGLTPSPSPRFKSSYAKSLADSYRRASIPVVVSSSKGQFYFKNDDFLSLSASPVRRADSSREKYYNMSMNGDGKAQLSHNTEPQSLSPFSESQQQQQQEMKKSKEKSDPSSLPTSVYERLLDEDVFVPFEQLHRLCEEQGSSFSLKDWHNLGSIITSDGRKLVKLSDVKMMMNLEEQPSKTQNGHHLLVNDSEKDSQQVETLLMERGQLGDRVNQLCRVLADRNATIQRLEEDLLRIRMECQRLIVDNRTLKSSLGHRGASQTHPLGADNPSQVSQLQQQVQLLTAQLNKAEQSRHTYEAATRQLVDFLHTVNSTLNNASHLNNTSSSSTTSPTCSLHSSASTTTIKTTSSIPVEAEDDPPYQLAHPSTPPPETLAPRHAVGHTTRRNAEAMRKAGSVWAIPTHNHNHHSRKVSRAASTHCVASIASSYQSEPAAAAASPGSERRRSFTSDFLASRARELLASLKSIMRSDSVLKLNLEPKKSGSSAPGGRSKSSSRTTKVEITPSVPSADTEPPIKALTVSASPQNSEAEGSRQPTTLTVPVDGEGSEKNSLTVNETNASLTVSQNLDTTSTAAASIPRIGTGKTREDTLQPQSSVLNGNPQPLSLMVVGEHPCNPSDQRFSSLPVRTRITRTLTDADHRLVWV